MTPHPLDNPVWASLTSRHAPLAIGSGAAKRYPPDVAPFVAIAQNAGATDAVESLVTTGELVCVVGPAPRLGAGWRVEQSVPIAQMICEKRLDLIDGPPMIEVTDEHLPDVLALTALVYPHYFRPRTPAMGRYFGIYEGSALAAMAGERMRFDGHTEISAVCTHPDYAGRGYARRLIAMLTNDILARGDVPFLHFSHENVRAKALYERIGFAYRGDIALLVTTRLR